MDAPHDIPLRSARDRVIDLLGIGDSYPLTDLDVVADNLTVPHNGRAEIPIRDAQVNVVYQLCDPKGKPLLGDGKLVPVDAYKAEGADAELRFRSPQVTDNVTYRILATKKKPADSALPPQSGRFLNEGAPVKVGIDTTLVIEMRDVEPLDPKLPTLQPSDPRIVPYGRSVAVWVNSSQEEVLYSLVVDGVDLPDTVRGNLHDVSLATGPMKEDAVIRVRATKKFLVSENRDTESALLDAKLYLKVMADPAAPVSVDGSPIVDYGQGATLQVAKAQASAKYRVYARTLPDVDFVHGAAAGVDVVSVAVPGKPDPAQVRKPPQALRWSLPGGYELQGEAPGAGADLKLAVKPRSDDAIVIVQAEKAHRVDVDKADSAIITSAVRLDQVAVVLVRPDPAKALKLRVPVSGAQTGDSLQVSGGQPGVFYYFRRAPSGAEFPPAYFHKNDQQDAPQNKGVGQLAVEVDFAVAANAYGGDPAANPATSAPRPPLLDIVPFATGASLSVRAMKAQSTVETKMTQSAQIAAVPAIRAEPPVVDYGASAKIAIPASSAADLYQLTLKGAPVKAALAGTGGDLGITGDPMQADATFELVVTSPADKGMAVERVVQVPVLVRPDATLAVSAKAQTVAKGAATDVVVQKTQLGVGYQLMSGQTAVGAALPGTGADIVLPTGPIAADTTFSVAATRADNAQLGAVLKAQASVKLAPPPAPPAPSPAPAPAPAPGPA